jgi:hypothetical protein
MPIVSVMTTMTTLAPVPALAAFPVLTALATFPVFTALAPLTLTITAAERDDVRDLYVGHAPIFRAIGRNSQLFRGFPVNTQGRATRLSSAGGSASGATSWRGSPTASRALTDVSIDDLLAGAPKPAAP